jgi:hypothetical protein
MNARIIAAQAHNLAGRGAAERAGRAIIARIIHGGLASRRWLAGE